MKALIQTSGNVIIEVGGIELGLQLHVPHHHERFRRVGLQSGNGTGDVTSLSARTASLSCFGELFFY